MQPEQLTSDINALVLFELLGWEESPVELQILALGLQEGLPMDVPASLPTWRINFTPDQGLPAAPLPPAITGYCITAFLVLSPDPA